MKERQFAGMLSSKKNSFGKSYGDASCFRFYKYSRIINIPENFNMLVTKWNRSGKFIHPSWGKGLWNFRGDITYSQRHEGLKYNQIRLFRWRK